MNRLIFIRLGIGTLAIEWWNPDNQPNVLWGRNLRYHCWYWRGRRFTWIPRQRGVTQ